MKINNKYLKMKISLLNNKIKKARIKKVAYEIIYIDGNL